MDDGALLGKGVRRERQRPEAWVVALAVVRTSEQGGMRKPEAGEARAGDAEAGRRCRRRAERGGGVRAAKAPKAASRAGEGCSREGWC